MLSSFKNRQETGFTLIELLTVIIIVGVLAAIAIPVFAAQRSRSQDSQTISDVRNIVTAAETLLTDRTKTVADLSQSSVEFASSKNVLWDIKGNATTGGYCIAAFNTSGKDYKSTSTLLTYDSTNGGLKKSGGSCGTTTAGGNTPSPTTSTAVGSSTATPGNGLPAGATAMAVGGSTTYDVSGSGADGTLQTWVVPTTGTYTIDTYGARGGNGNGTAGGNGARAYGTVTLTAGDNLRILVGQSGLNYITNSGDGSYYNGSGGGGTFVYNTTQSNLLMVAGGGGGGNNYGYNGDPGNNEQRNSNINNSTIGTAGAQPNGTQACAGAGYTGSNAGTCAAGSANPAKSFLNGGRGGISDSPGYYVNGGFGGGGASGYRTGGAGGGYSGGDAVYYQFAYGGGSFISGTNTGWTKGTNNTPGRVVITRVS